MKKLLFIMMFHLIGLALFGQMPDVSFTQPWNIPAQGSLNGDVLTLTGTAGQSVAATLRTNIPSMRTLYFIAEVRMTDIVFGSASWDRPKFKLYGSSGAKIIAQNLDTSLQGTWLTVALDGVVNNDWAVTLEIGIQNCTGTFEIRNPYITDTMPAPVYAYPFDIPADTSSTISINTNGGTPFVNDILSVNSLFSRSDFGYEDQRIQDLIRYINLPHLRFPGGTVANYYDWETDTFYNDSLALSSGARLNFYRSGRTFEFGHYANLTKETGATSCLMFNTIYDSVDKSKNRLINRIASGITINWIEMGNENYYAEQRGGLIPDIYSYISHTKALAAGLKEIDPSVKVAVNVDHGTYTEGTWSGLLAAENYYDAAVIHNYLSPSTAIYGKLAIYQILSGYKSMTDRIDEYKAHFSVPAIMSEWAIYTDANYIRTLATADTFFALMDASEAGVLVQAGIHILFDSGSTTGMQMFGWDGSKMTASDLGIMYTKYSYTFRDSTMVSGPATSAELRDGLPAVNARAVVSVDGKTRIVAVNKLSVNSTMNIILNNAAYTGSYALESYSADPLSNPVYAYNADPWDKSSGSGNPVLPPMSINVITLDSAAPPVSLGDVNDDRQVNIIDALMTAQYYVGLNPNGFIPSNADVNRDGGVNIIDALMIAQYYVGLITSF